MNQIYGASQLLLDLGDQRDSIEKGFGSRVLPPEQEVDVALCRSFLASYRAEHEEVRRPMPMGNAIEVDTMGSQDLLDPEPVPEPNRPNLRHAPEPGLAAGTDFRPFGPADPPRVDAAVAVCRSTLHAGHAVPARTQNLLIPVGVTCSERVSALGSWRADDRSRKCCRCETKRILWEGSAFESRLRVLDVRERMTDPPALLAIVEGFTGILVHATTVEPAERDLVNALEEHLCDAHRAKLVEERSEKLHEAREVTGFSREERVVAIRHRARCEWTPNELPFSDRECGRAARWAHIAAGRMFFCDEHLEAYDAEKEELRQKRSQRTERVRGDTRERERR